MASAIPHADAARRGPFESGPFESGSSQPFGGDGGNRDPHFDNQPPLEERIVMDFMEDLQRPGELGQKSIAGRIDELMASAARAPEACDSETIAGSMGDLCKQAREVAARLETAREKHNRPLLNAQRALKARADGLIDPLNGAVAKLRRLLDDFTRAEDRRRQEEARRAEEARRIAEDAAAAALKEQGMEDQIEHVAPAPIAAPAPAPIARGNYGSRVGTTTEWKHKVLSVRQLPNNVLNHPTVLEAIDKVLRARIRGGERNIKGTEIWPETKASIR